MQICVRAKTQYRCNFACLITPPKKVFCLIYLRFCCVCHLLMTITNRIQSVVCKFTTKRSNKPNHGCTQMQIAKIGLFFAYFQKFGQGAILQMFKMLLRLHFAMRHTCMPPNSGGQTPKIAPTTAETVFCAKFESQNYKISCLCSNVSQKFNVEITCNIISQSFGKCTYLYGIQASQAHARICTRNVHANNVAERIQSGQSAKRIFP